MNVKILLVSVLLLFISYICHGQINYTYTDPCTGTNKTLQIPNDGITVTYYSQIKTFTPNDFYNGIFNKWSNDVFNSFGKSSPCSIAIGLPAAVNVAQSTALNFLGIVNSLSSLSDIANNLPVINTNTSSSKKNNDINQSNGNRSSDLVVADGISNGNTTNSNNSGNSKESTGSKKESDIGNGKSENSNNSSTVGNGNGSSNETSSENSESVESGSSNLIGGSVSSIQTSSTNNSPNSKNGNRPSILASSDFVGFNFKNSEVNYGSRISGGYTSMRWDGKRSHGITGDYTTALKGPNITAFYAFMNQNRIDLISTSFTVGFEQKMTMYNTIAIGQMWTINKLSKMKAIYMLTGSFGKIHEESFIGTAMIAGGMHDLSFTKRVGVKVLLLYVYAPYVSYYNDILLNSPHVILPIIGTNIGITKRFKININTGGSWALKEAALNYTIMMGTRLLL
jgi:hypothetical protein